MHKIMCISLLSFLTATSCSKPPNSVGALPDNPAWKIDGTRRQAAILRSALQYCDEEEEHIARMCPACAVPLGQVQLVREQLQTPAETASRMPIAIYAITGTAGDGDRYLSVTAFSWERAVDRVLILARNRKGDSIIIELATPIESRSLEAIVTKYVPVDLISWEALAQRTSGDAHKRLVIACDGNLRVPIPAEDGVTMCVAVGDQLGGKSAYIPACRFDYPRAGPSAGERNVDQPAQVQPDQGQSVDGPAGR